MKDEKITLTISADYLKHWTAYDALRELYQNLFDREIEDESARWNSDISFKGNEYGTLTLTSLNSSLTRRTLILGESTKTDDNKTIGKFGEGYKLAILVLLREGMTVKIFTGNEIWNFNLEYNEQFDAKMLTVTITPTPPDGVNNEDLIMQVINMPKRIWSSYSQYNLLLQRNVQKIDTDKCEVLLDTRNRSKLFLGGLFVSKYHGTSLYGYNFKPEVFTLGRDRNIVEGLSANWEAARALTQATIENLDVLKNVVDNMDSDDIANAEYFKSSINVLADALWDKFITAHPGCIPVYDQWSRDELEKKYINIALISVTSKEETILELSLGYGTALASLEKRPPAPEPSTVVNEFYDIYSGDMSDIVKAAYAKDVMTEAVNWEVSR